jgi:hypothetical protein
MQGEGPKFYPEAKPRSESVCRCLGDVGQFPVGRQISTIASLTGSFALAFERTPSLRPVLLGGKPGGEIVKRRDRCFVVAYGRLALWPYLAGQVLAPPGGGRGSHSIAPAWPQQFAPHQQSGSISRTVFPAGLG